MKKSQLKEYIKNEILSIINEEDKDKKKKRPDAEDEAAAELDANEPIDTDSPVSVSSPQDVQKELMDALEAAKSLGDKKLVRQIGNALTYFTRTQISQDEEA
jgi:hypothetical protein